MNAPARIEPMDDIRTFLPGIPADEYDRRVKLRSYRNAATAMVHNTDSDTARALAWIAIEYVTFNLYAPADPDQLDDLGRFCKRLMLTAMQAEDIDLNWKTQ